jgi:hypothetical protein
MAVFTKDGSDRFATINIEEYNELLRDKDSVHTQRSTEKAVKVLRAYCRARNIPESFEELEKPALSELLTKFYVEVRREDGELYKTGSMLGLRTGICRFLKNTGRPIDIIKEPDL